MSFTSKKAGEDSKGGRAMKKLKLISILGCLILLSALAYGDSHFYVFGKGNFIGSSGSADDYLEGENEFPLVASYKNFGAGLGLTFGRVVFAGFEGHYNFSGVIQSWGGLSLVYDKENHTEAGIGIGQYRRDAD